MLGETQPQALSWRNPSLGHVELEIHPILCGQSGSEGERGLHPKARPLLFGQTGRLLGGRVTGSGSGMMGSNFFKKKDKVYKVEGNSPLKGLEGTERAPGF